MLLALPLINVPVDVGDHLQLLHFVEHQHHLVDSLLVGRQRAKLPLKLEVLLEGVRDPPEEQHIDDGDSAYQVFQLLVASQFEQQLVIGGGVGGYVGLRLVPSRPLVQHLGEGVDLFVLDLELVGEDEFLQQVVHDCDLILKVELDVGLAEQLDQH